MIWWMEAYSMRNSCLNDAGSSGVESLLKALLRGALVFGRELKKSLKAFMVPVVLPNERLHNIVEAVEALYREGDQWIR